MGAYESTGYAVFTSLEHSPNTNRGARKVPNKCGICHKVLTLSKSLRCGDNFCESCLEAYADGKAAIVCPTCGEAAVLPPGGVLNLPDNLWILPTESELAPGERNQAFEPVVSENQSSVVCPDHFGGQDAFFCKNCDRVVCKECLASGQCQHEPTPLTDSIKRKQLELQKAFIKWREQAAEKTSGLLQDLDENVGKKVAGRLQAGKEAAEKFFQQNGVKESGSPSQRRPQDKKSSDDVRILLLGDSGSGKTYVMSRYTGLADGDPDSTLCIDFCRKVEDIDGRKINLQLWDTSGDARFRSVISRYFRQADAVVLVYDASHPESFEKVKWWRDDFLTITAASNTDEVFLDSHGNANEETAKEDATPFDDILDNLKTTAEETSSKVSTLLDEFVDFVKTSVSEGEKEDSRGRPKSTVAGGMDTERGGGAPNIAPPAEPFNPAAGPSDKDQAGGLESQERTDVPFIVIGNMKFQGSEDDQKVVNEEAQAWCDSKAIPYVETDCQDRSVLDRAFHTLIRNVLQNRRGRKTE